MTAGRGRRGAVWVSTPGNLYATLLLTEPSPPAIAPQLSFVAALALHDAVASSAPQLGPSLALKWPNDLLLGGAKVAGAFGLPLNAHIVYFFFSEVGEAATLVGAVFVAAGSGTSGKRSSAKKSALGPGP